MRYTYLQNIEKWQFCHVVGSIGQLINNRYVTWESWSRLSWERLSVSIFPLVFEGFLDVLFLLSSGHFCPKCSEVGFLENRGFETNVCERFFVLTVYNDRTTNSLQMRCLWALCDVFWPSYINFSAGQTLLFQLFLLRKKRKNRFCPSLNLM